MKRTIVILPFLLIISCVESGEKSKIDFDERKVSLGIIVEPESCLITGLDFISKEVFFNKGYKQNESIQFVQRNKPLQIEGNTSINDSTNGFRLYIGNILFVDNNSDDAQIAFEEFKTGFIAGLRPITRGLATIKLDSIISYGDYSEFRSYMKDDKIVAYTFITRCGEFGLLTIITSNHLHHFDVEKVLLSKLINISKAIGNNHCSIKGTNPRSG